jgi:hypothetical protein
VNGLVDAGTARQHLIELAAAWFPLTHIAEFIGADDTTLYNIRSGRVRRTNSYTARRIAHAHQQLASTDPADHGIPPRAIHTAQLIAGRNGWTTTERTTT